MEFWRESTLKYSLQKKEPEDIVTATTLSL
jgi:hypothetical protein